MSSDADMKQVIEHVFNVTLGVAQKVHEYCEVLAQQIAEKNWVFHSSMLETTNLLWLQRGLRKSYSIIDGHLNSRDTTVARRNQVIYTIGKITKHTFDSSALEQLIRIHFPTSVTTNMGIGAILSDLASTSPPLLKRNAKTNEYSVIDPRSIMCIRLILYVDPVSNKVIKRGFGL